MARCTACLITGATIPLSTTPAACRMEGTLGGGCGMIATRVGSRCATMRSPAFSRWRSILDIIRTSSPRHSFRTARNSYLEEGSFPSTLEHLRGGINLLRSEEVWGMWGWLPMVAELRKSGMDIRYGLPKEKAIAW